MSGYDGETFLHLQVDSVDVKDTASYSGVEDEKFFLKGWRAFFNPVSNNFLDPHFDSFPASKSGEEIEFLDFLIDLFFFQPFI